MGDRLDELDVARALALLGMLLQHNLWSSGWLAYLGELPAMLFVVTIGVGAGVRHAGVRDHGAAASAARWLDVAWRALALVALAAWLTALGGPLAVVLASLAVVGVVLEPLIHVTGVAGDVAAAVIGLSALALQVAVRSVSGMGADVPWWADVPDFVSAGRYPVAAWVACGAFAYLAGRHWERIRSSGTRVFLAGAVAATVGLVAVGHAASRVAARVDADIVFVQHQLWEWDHADSMHVGPADVGRLVPYSGTPAMSLLSTSVSLLLVAALGLVLRRNRAGTLARPLILVGRVALTGYVIHVVATSRCMSSVDLSWQCGELREGRFVLVQVVLFLVIAMAWRRVHWPAHGPVELLLRVPAVSRRALRRWQGATTAGLESAPVTTSRSQAPGKSDAPALERQGVERDLARPRLPGG